MADLKQKFGTEGARSFLNTELNSLSDGFYTSSEPAVDLGDPSPLGLVLEIKLTGTVSSTGPVELYALWSQDGIDFSDEASAAKNGELIGVVDMNGTTETKRILQMPVRARHLRIRARNVSGAALAFSAGAVIGTDAFLTSV